MQFVKTTFYKTNIRKTGKLKPKIKTIISSISHALVKLEETESTLPEILIFDLMNKFKLIFLYVENKEMKISILTHAEYQELTNNI